MKMRKTVRVILTAAMIAGSLFLLQRLLVPKYVSDVVEGGLIAEYYGEEKDHDVVFIGDCEVYENFSSPVIDARIAFTLEGDHLIPSRVIRL